MKVLIIVLLYSVYSIEISPETWNKEKIDIWLESIGMRNHIDLFEARNINSGFKLKYIDKNILDNDFKEMSDIDKKTILAEIILLFKIQDIPEGIWRAFEMNPRLTAFIFGLYNASPRLTYLILYNLNPSILSGVFQEEIQLISNRLFSGQIVLL